MAFHEHSTLTVTRLEDGNLELKCTTCGKTWTSGFQYYVKTNAVGKVIDRGILDSLTQKRISCDALDGDNRLKKSQFVIIKK